MSFQELSSYILAISIAVFALSLYLCSIKLLSTFGPESYFKIEISVVLRSCQFGGFVVLPLLYTFVKKKKINRKQRWLLAFTKTNQHAQEFWMNGCFFNLYWCVSLQVWSLMFVHIHISRVSSLSCYVLAILIILFSCFNVCNRRLKFYYFFAESYFEIESSVVWWCWN